jgi:hypothetical protein
MITSSFTSQEFAAILSEAHPSEVERPAAALHIAHRANKPVILSDAAERPAAALPETYNNPTT